VKSLWRVGGMGYAAKLLADLLADFRQLAKNFSARKKSREEEAPVPRRPKPDEFCSSNGTAETVLFQDC
jgi:hypothetical protein